MADLDSSIAKVNRRDLLGGSLAVAAGLALGVAEPAQARGLYRIRHNTFKQGVAQWSFDWDIDPLCQAAARIGIKGVDLVDPKDWGALKTYDLICSMAWGNKPDVGLCQPDQQAEAVSLIRAAIDACAAEHYPNVICFAGKRKGLSDEEGLKNCATALKSVVGYAEEKGVTLCMELVNSVLGNLVDSMCDHTAWGVKLVDAVGSERFKLIYDVYHMQLMEGNVINTIQKYGATYFAHYHTAGVPDDGDPDDAQELNYKAIVRAIAATGFKGYVIHEFKPRGVDKAQALSNAAKIFDI